MLFGLFVVFWAHLPTVPMDCGLALKQSQKSFVTLRKMLLRIFLLFQHRKSFGRRESECASRIWLLQLDRLTLMVPSPRVFLQKFVAVQQRRLQARPSPRRLRRVHQRLTRIRLNNSLTKTPCLSVLECIDFQKLQLATVSFQVALSRSSMEVGHAQGRGVGFLLSAAAVIC